MILIRNGLVYTPDPIGTSDVLLVGNHIAAIGPKLSPGSLSVAEIDATGLIVVPGLIDGHTHFAGAGGEGGPASRTPELQLSDFTSSGITTAIGCLGTDGMTRTPASLLMKAKGLIHDGMSCRIYSGSYQVPPPTVTGDLAHDICYIEEVIGAGEIAIADGRSSAPTALDLARLAKTARVAGMLAGKSGVLHLHMGDEPAPFALLYEAVRLSGLPFGSFYPTHVNRNAVIFSEAVAWGKRGPMDITTSSYPAFSKIEIKPSRAFAELLALGVPAEHITMSSDAGGSLPRFDEAGRLTSLSMGKPDTLLAELGDAVLKEGVSLETALAAVTANPARILGLAGKGHLVQKGDADLVVLDEDLRVRHVIARGRHLVADSEPLMLGRYE